MNGVWWHRFTSGVLRFAALVILALLSPGCADDPSSTAFSAIAAVPVSKDDTRTGSADDAAQSTELGATDLEDLTSNEVRSPANFGATVEIDEFFFAPIGFPGFGAISGNCNLDDDPYGACL